jgi:hypothetical protein
LGIGSSSAVFWLEKTEGTGSMGKTSMAESGIVIYINQEKHTFNESDDLTQSLNDYLRRKTRFKVGHA